MTHDTYKYRFDESVPAQELEDTFMLAMLAVESLHGRSRMRRESRFSLDKARRTCVIDASTDVGSDLARIFTGFSTKEYGERSVLIERSPRRRQTRKLEAMMDHNCDGVIDTLRQHMREMHGEIADLRDKLTACQTALAMVLLETAPGSPAAHSYPDSELPLSIVNAVQTALEKSKNLHGGALTFHVGYPLRSEWAALMAAVERAETRIKD